MKRFSVFFAGLWILPKLCLAIELIPPPLATVK